MNTRVVNEFNNKGKKNEVRGMFNHIAKRYDFLDHFLSLCLDKRWRRLAIKTLKEKNPKLILDIATGTADLAICEAKYLKPEKLIGVDIAENMMEVGRQKVAARGFQNIIELQYGDAEDLPFESNMFDAVSVSFGVRNFENLNKGLEEIKRVLKPSGKLMILEFSLPKKGFFNKLYLFYFNRLVPLLGALVAKDRKAYQYLPGSVSSFPGSKEFSEILKKSGFNNVRAKRLSLGICTIYNGIK